MLKRFVAWNVRLSHRFTPHALWDTRGFAIYDWVAKALLGEPDVTTVLDVGAGRTWPFGHDFKTKRGIRLIGVDVDAAEIALNPSLDRAIVADVCQSLGVDDNAIDLILCRATIEHLPDTTAFLRNCFAALRPGGKAVLVFANRWAPYAILNRMLPERISHVLLEALVPNSKGYQGFEAHYDKCSHSEFRDVATRLGFDIDYTYSSYYQSSYYQFFFPLHCASILIDHLRAIISVRDLSSMNVFVLVKPSPSSTQSRHESIAGAERSDWEATRQPASALSEKSEQPPRSPRS